MTYPDWNSQLHHTFTAPLPDESSDMQISKFIPPWELLSKLCVSRIGNTSIGMEKRAATRVRYLQQLYINLSYPKSCMRWGGQLKSPSHKQCCGCGSEYGTGRNRNFLPVRIRNNHSGSGRIGNKMEWQLSSQTRYKIEYLISSIKIFTFTFFFKKLTS
jgi:hypothetical protein